MKSLADIFPDAKVALEVEPEELGAALMELWGPTSGGNNDMCHLAQFTEPLYSVPDSIYPRNTKRELELAVAEALSWLEREGLIVRDPGQPAEWYRRSRRGLRLKTRMDVAAFRRANLLPRGLLHPAIDQKAWPLFLRGDYDVAVHQAFKTVEVAVRRLGEYPDDLTGTKLMRAAFDADKGPLADMTLVKAEREATAHLFAGAIGLCKNPHSHREQPLKSEEAARLLMFASYLVEVVDLRALIA